MAIAVRLFGPVDARVDGVVVDLGPPQQRALLALLALHTGSAVHVDAIIDTLWPDNPPPSAGKVVQTYVSRLRKLLGAEAIRHSAHGYVLDGETDVDVVRFRELLAARRTREALDLWRAAPLADVPQLLHERHRLEELRLSALEDDAADLPPDELAELVTANPHRERLLGQLVLALYRAGRQADALAAYRDGRRRLVDDLGLDPTPELRDLERRILQHDPSLLPPTSGRRRPPPRRRTLVVAAAAVVVVAIVAVAAIPAARHPPSRIQLHANQLLEIDPATNHVVSAFPVGRDEAGLMATSDALWMASERERTVSRFDLRTHALRTIGEPKPVAFLAHDDRGNVYASGWDFPFVWQIDPHTVQIVRTYRVHTRALSLAVGGGSLWVTDRLANEVTRIDLAQRRGAGTTPLGANPLAATFGFGALWVASRDTASVQVIRLGTQRPLTIAKTIPLPYAISAGAGGVWVASNQEGAVYRIDPDFHSVVAEIPLGTPGDYLYGVAAGSHGVWAVESHHVVRIDPSRDTVTWRLRFPPAAEPKAVAFTPDAVWIAVGNPKDDM